LHAVASTISTHAQIYKLKHFKNEDTLPFDKISFFHKIILLFKNVFATGRKLV
jgi:hypothetical protein